MKKLLLGLLISVCLNAQASQYYSDYLTAFTSPDSPTSNDGSIIVPPTMPFYMFLNTTTKDLYFSDSTSNTDLTYYLLITSTNLLSQLANLGWNTNIPRDYSTVSLSFGSSRTPNVAHDTQVLAVVTMTNVLASSTDVQAQVDCGSGFVKRFEIGHSFNVLGILSGSSMDTQTLSFTAPANCAYKLVSTVSGGGGNAIVSVNELSQ